MGLNCTHGFFDGSYGSFTNLKVQVAQAAGYPIRKAGGLYGGYDIVDIDYQAYPKDVQYGHWDNGNPDDILMVLFMHSDCEGCIHPQQGALLANRLEVLVPLVDEEWQERVEEMVSGLREAAAWRQDIIFH